MGGKSAKSVQRQDEDDKVKKSTGFRSLFRVIIRYSSAPDIALHSCGFLAACVAGSTLPLMTIVWGSSVDKFNAFGAGHLSSSAMYDEVTKLGLWFLYLFIARLFLIYTYTICFGFAATRATRRFRHDFLKSLLRQDVAYLDTCSPGTIASTVSNNADVVENTLGERVGGLVFVLSMIISAFVVAFTRQWKLTLVTGTSLPAIIAGFGLTFALDAKIEATIVKIYSTAGGLVHESLSSVRIVAAFEASRKLRQKYEAYLDEVLKLGFRKGPIIGAQYSVDMFLMYCSYSVAWYYGIKLLLRDEVSGGGRIITVLFSVLMATNYIARLVPIMGDFSTASASAQAMFDVIDRESKIDPLLETGKRLPELAGNICLQDVSFAYPARPTVKVLQNMSISFEAGKTTALVGASGSGKSTIIGLILRWFDPVEGCVNIDTHEARTLNLGWMRSQIGLVQQDPVLFSDTIYNNVVHGLYGTEKDQLPEDKKHELVRQACVEAFADDFIQELPERYDTMVGEQGTLLSGGQRQRIAIARSVIANPSILLLDEATSALDPQAERSVQAALNRVSKSRTTIVVAHKLATIQKAERIVVLNRGEVVESGTHQQLLAIQGSYHKLVTSQALVKNDSDAESVSNSSESSDIAEDEKFERALLDSNATEKLSLDSTQQDKEEDQAGGRPTDFSLLRCIFIILQDQRQLWPLILIGSIAATGAGGIFAAQSIVFSKSMVMFQLPPGDELQRQGNFWALMYFVLALGALVSYGLVGSVFTMAGFRATRFYRSEYFHSMLQQDVSFFDKEGNSAAEMTSRLSMHPSQLQSLLSSNIGLILIVVVNILSCSILALVKGPQLAIVIIVGTLPPLFLAGFLRMRIDSTSQAELSKMYHESARFASETVGAIRTVSSLTLEKKILQNYESRLQDSSGSQLRRKLISMLLLAFGQSTEIGVYGFAFWYGGKLLSEGKYNSETFFVVYIAIVFGGNAAGTLFGYTLNITKARGAANSIIGLRRSRPPINLSSGVKEFTANNEKTPAIQFKNVTFAYPSQPHSHVLRNVSLEFNQGESVGIVGASGSGKTTVAALVERFYDVKSGEVLINGTPIKNIDVRFHRSRIGMVSQDKALYQGSIKDNVLLGLENMGDSDSSVLQDQVVQACKAANIHDFITSLPAGYDTDIGARGVSLSGGQCQRIAIARALIRDPEILLFDEATSALDTENESIVQAAIESAARRKPSRTTITVAHRLSTVKRCDRIFVLNRGEVVEVDLFDGMDVEDKK
ncbi:multidrug resistance protein 1 [Stemphylium lycopersici]|uniref:Multidrug resistance protein n=1 Tax=Stemphylium lycopersici TaxID=183478 RepID=A0A364MUX2_STELY|nr:multidrug resistance protein 1 [Stemphylium lycopersici]RAR03533.1 multidrug resistance protein [Stemphylium lycopersici]